MRRVNRSNDDFRGVRRALERLLELEKQYPADAEGQVAVLRYYGSLFSDKYSIGTELYRFERDDSMVVTMLKSAAHSAILHFSVRCRCPDAYIETDWAYFLKALLLSVCFCTSRDYRALSRSVGRLALDEPDGTAGCYRIASSLFGEWVLTQQVPLQIARELLDAASRAPDPYVKRCFGSIASACLDLNNADHFFACLDRSLAAHKTECFEGEFQYAPEACMALPQMALIQLARHSANALDRVATEYHDYLPLRLLADLQ